MANVNRPTDFAQKEKDVNQKLQFYGIFTAFSNGKVPSNQQIDVALNSLLRSRALGSPSKNLSREGQELVGDVKEVINEAKRLLLSKNQGNLIQEFVWDAQGISGGNASRPNAPVDKATARQHGDEALDGLKTLGRLILSNGQFRKLLDDALILARDVAGDAAQSAANKVNPSEDRLKSIDEPAEDNTWHDVPNISREDMKKRASDAYQTNKPFSREDAKNAAREGADTAQQHPSSDNQQAGKAGASNAAQNLKNKAEANVPEETKEKARNASSAVQQKSKNYLGKKMPQERREQTVYRLKKMIVEIQGHSDYQEAIETLLNLAERYSRHGRDLAQQSTGTVKGARQDSELQRCETNLKTLIERFANFTSTDDITDALNEIYRDADRDPELRNWFKDVNKYIRKCLREQGYVLQDSSDREWDRLYDKAQFLFRDRYRDHADHLVDEIKFLVDQFDQDPQNRAFAQAAEKLFLDLGRDENGTPAFKPHLIKDLTEVIIPAIFANTRYVPIPRIEVSDPMIDLIVENLVIESDNLFPNSLEFSTDNYWRFGRKTIRGKRENKVMIAGSGIQMDLRDVSYYLKKKQGFPSITDKGIMDIILAGEGFSFKIAARNAHKGSDRTHFIAIDKVDVVVHELAIKIKKSNHKLLFTMAKSIVLKVMKPAIQKAIEKQIKDNFEKADAYAYDIYREVEKGKEAAKRDPENAGNIYQQWVSAFQTKAMQKKKKAEAASKDMEVNIAMTQQDSMFKHIQLPGGISTKATEYKELAEKGERWQSPIFGIGSASQSSDIPRASEVKRKPHSTRSGGVRGGNHPSSSNTSNTAAAGLTSGGRSGDYGTTSGSSRGYDIGSSGTSGYDSRTGQTSGLGNVGGAGYDSRSGQTSGIGGIGGTSGYDNRSGQTSGLGGISGIGGTSGQTTGLGAIGGASGRGNPGGPGFDPSYENQSGQTSGIGGIGGTSGYDNRSGQTSGLGNVGGAGYDNRSGQSTGLGGIGGTSGYDNRSGQTSGLGNIGGASSGYGTTSGQTTSGLGGITGGHGTTGTSGTTGYDIRGGGPSGYTSGGPTGAYEDIRSGNTGGYGTQSGTAGFYGDESNSRNTALPSRNVPGAFTSEVDQALNPTHNTTYYDSATNPPRQ